MTRPSYGQVHPVNPVLTNMSIAYMQSARSLARAVFPVVPVGDRKGVYQKFDKGDFFRDEAKLRAPGDPIEQTGYAMSTGSYECKEYAIGHKMPDEIRASYQGPMQADQAAVALLSQRVLTRESRLFASTFMATSVWGTDITGVASGPSTNEVLRWDVANADPIGDIRTGCSTLRTNLGGLKPNTLVMGQAVWDVLVDHDDLLSRLNTNSLQIVTEDLVAALFGLERVIVLGDSYNSAAAGATTTMANIVGKSALLAYVASSPSVNTPSAGYVASWSPFDGVSSVNAVGISMRRDEATRSDIYEGSSYFDLIVSASDAGYYFTSIVT